MKKTGAEIIIHLLEERGIEIISGIPGSANLPLYDALSNSRIIHVLARHEQGAGFIAQGMARSTGKAAVCFATSGPGTTNLLTAIADAKLDSVPIVAITGQVPTSMIGKDAFQEIDTYGLTIPITKHNFLVRSAEELLTVIPEAFIIAESGRPGPVVIDVPKDVQLQYCEVPDELSRNVGKYEQIADWFHDNRKSKDYQSGQKSNICGEVATIDDIMSQLNNSIRPVILYGAGIIESNSEAELLNFAEKNNIPVISTLRGLGAFPGSHPLYLGMIGMHGTKHANQLIEEADIVLALGVRFDDRATGKITEFCSKAKIIHIDIDKAEIDKIMISYKSICIDLKSFFINALPLLKNDNRKEWIVTVETMKRRNQQISYNENDIFHPVSLIKKVATHIPENSIITTDVGQHQMWVAMNYPINSSRSFLTSAGLGTMGFGLPAAIGASLANPDKKVVCFTGDGSIHMNIQELATLAEVSANVTVIIFNNGFLGLVRQQQELFYGKRYIASQFNVRPDLVMVARGFGIKSFDLEKENKPEETLKEALSLDGPVVINVPVSSTENVFPMVPPGAANRIMIG
jgi:acetolactate synthase-1/2/3 large subunit